MVKRDKIISLVLNSSPSFCLKKCNIFWN